VARFPEGSALFAVVRSRVSRYRNIRKIPKCKKYVGIYAKISLSPDERKGFAEFVKELIS
jgi:hypothetical protein